MSNELPDGFEYSGVACGIKSSSTRDLSLIVSKKPCVAVGVYTQNIVRASSISWNEGITPSSNLRAIVVNSGNANACTGELGIQNTQKMAEWTAKSISQSHDQVDPDQVLVLSTGVIGVQLPMEKIESGIELAAQQLSQDKVAYYAAIDGIRTTDKDQKKVLREQSLSGQKTRIAAMAKGAGMIGPRMATMLSIVTTDLALPVEKAQTLLRNAVDQSFNRISVEGHTSTNDAVILLCPRPAEGTELEPEDWDLFSQGMTEVLVELAKMIPADGEGATHLIQIEVTGAEDDKTADQIARTIGGSNLVKTAVTGADPNWGRIVSAIGILDLRVDPNEISLSINGFPIFRSGQPLDFDAKQVSQSIDESFETQFVISVGAGSGSSIHWTSDLTVDYVRFNSEYTT